MGQPGVWEVISVRPEYSCEPCPSHTFSSAAAPAETRSRCRYGSATARRPSSLAPSGHHMWSRLTAGGRR